MKPVAVPAVWSWKRTIGFVAVLLALVVLLVSGVVLTGAAAGQASGGGRSLDPTSRDVGASALGAAVPAARATDPHPAISSWEYTPTAREVVLGWIALAVSVAVAFGARAVGKARGMWRGW